VYEFFAVFDESFYLANNPDVAFSVAAGAFSSGLDHFQRLAFRKVTLVSPSTTKGFILRKYPDVAA